MLYFSLTCTTFAIRIWYFRSLCYHFYFQIDSISFLAPPTPTNWLGCECE